MAAQFHRLLCRIAGGGELASRQVQQGAEDELCHSRGIVLLRSAFAQPGRLLQIFFCRGRQLLGKMHGGEIQQHRQPPVVPIEVCRGLPSPCKSLRPPGSRRAKNTRPRDCWATALSAGGLPPGRRCWVAQPPPAASLNAPYPAGFADAPTTGSAPPRRRPAEALLNRAVRVAHLP